MKQATTTLLLLLALAIFGTASAQQTVTLNFAATLVGQEVTCGVLYEGVGAEGSTVEFQDMRFYVSDVRLLTAEGEEVPLTLDQGQWQHQNVALLDFEDGTARCAESGNEATNSTVTGTVAEGDYTGVVFNMGVPFDLNHADVATAPTPLNVSSMWWSWQSGYKHARIDLMSHTMRQGAMMAMQEGETTGGSATGGGTGGDSVASGHSGAPSAGLWPIHIGSTGCVSEASVISPETPCANPNLMEVRLENFDLENGTIIADVSSLLEGVDVSQSLETAPPGCMSGPEDPDCNALFGNLSLSPDATSQTFFRTETQTASQ